MRSMLLAFCGAALAVMQAGCVAIPQAPVVELKNKFDGDETLRYLEKGPNVIKGSALLRQAGGGVVTCAGLDVQLVPATSYAEERMKHIYGSAQGGFLSIYSKGVVFNPTSAVYETLNLKSVCDAQGYFKFENVHDGDFYVISVIVWQSGSGREGGFIAQRVSVQGGEVREMVLSQR